MTNQEFASQEKNKSSWKEIFVICMEFLWKEKRFEDVILHSLASSPNSLQSTFLPNQTIIHKNVTVKACDLETFNVKKQFQIKSKYFCDFNTVFSNILCGSI